MLFGNIRSRYRRFKNHNKYDRPALVLTVDLLIFATQALLLLGFFAGVFYLYQSR